MQTDLDLYMDFDAWSSAPLIPYSHGLGEMEADFDLYGDFETHNMPRMSRPLPIELVTEIAQYLPPRGLFSLALVSHDCQLEAESFLYRYIYHLPTGATFLGLMDTLIHHSRRAALVRELVIPGFVAPSWRNMSATRTYSQNRIRELQTLVSEALRSVPNLQFLCIEGCLDGDTLDAVEYVELLSEMFQGIRFHLKKLQAHIGAIHPVAHRLVNAQPELQVLLLHRLAVVDVVSPFSVSLENCHIAEGDVADISTLVAPRLKSLSLAIQVTNLRTRTPLEMGQFRKQVQYLDTCLKRNVHISSLVLSILWGHISGAIPTVLAAVFSPYDNLQSIVLNILAEPPEDRQNQFTEYAKEFMRLCPSIAQVSFLDYQDMIDRPFLRLRDLDGPHELPMIAFRRNANGEPGASREAMLRFDGSCVGDDWQL